MSDPVLRSDETILVRTQEVYVKSIPFEGILTNKRIVLVDRVKNLQPPKEIPLVTIKDVESGENAIHDPIITVKVITRTGELRQMILTFSPTSGDNRSNERDEWVKTLKENVSSSNEPAIRKGIPGLYQSHKRPKPVPPQRIEGIGDPVLPAAASPLPEKEYDTIHPIKKIIDNVPSKTPTIAKESDGTLPGYRIICSRCGNKVPEGSGFCNRCGSSIIPPVITAPVAPIVPDHQTPEQRPIDREIQTIEPLIEPSSVKVPDGQPISVLPEPPMQKTAQPAQSPPYDHPPEPVATPEPSPVITAQKPEPAKKPMIPRIFSPNELAPTPLNPASMPTAASPPPEKPRPAIRMPGKKVFMAIGVIILLLVIALAGVVFVYPMISGNGSPIPGFITGVSATTSTPVATSTPASPGTRVLPVATTAPAVPSSGVYAHISYIGGWKGTYGMPAALQAVTNSGNRFLEIENATGSVSVTAEKLDSSTRHELVVEIYKNGGLLTTGKTSEGFGKVTVSADATTGIAQPPQAGTGTLNATAAPTTASGSSAAVNVTATSSPAKNVTTVKTTAPVTNTTTSSS